VDRRRRVHPGRRIAAIVTLSIIVTGRSGNRASPGGAGSPREAGPNDHGTDPSRLRGVNKSSGVAPLVPGRRVGGVLSVLQVDQDLAEDTQTSEGSNRGCDIHALGVPDAITPLTPDPNARSEVLLGAPRLVSHAPPALTSIYTGLEAPERCFGIGMLGPVGRSRAKLVGTRPSCRYAARFGGYLFAMVLMLIGLLLIAIAAGFATDVFVQNSHRVDVEVLGRHFTVRPGWLVVAGIVVLAVFLLGARLIAIGAGRARRRTSMLRGAEGTARERDQLARQLAFERGSSEDATTSADLSPHSADALSSSVD